MSKREINDLKRATDTARRNHHPADPNTPRRSFADHLAQCTHCQSGRRCGEGQEIMDTLAPRLWIAQNTVGKATK